MKPNRFAHWTLANDYIIYPSQNIWYKLKYTDTQSGREQERERESKWEWLRRLIRGVRPECLALNVGSASKNALILLWTKTERNQHEVYHPMCSSILTERKKTRPTKKYWFNENKKLVHHSHFAEPEHSLGNTFFLSLSFQLAVFGAFAQRSSHW